MNLDRFRKACDRAWRKIRSKEGKYTWNVSVPAGLYKPISTQVAFPACIGSPFPFVESGLTKEPAMFTTHFSGETESNTYFKLFQSKRNRQWYFSIHGGNHRIIAQSEGYKRKESAEKAIATLRRETAAATVKE